MEQELKINLAALKKSDEFVLDILETSAQVALYKFHPRAQEWKKTEVEGSLFLYRRSTLPRFALMILNKLNRENMNEHITKEMEFEVQEPFLLYKNSSMGILGIWFNNSDKCSKIGRMITSLYASPPPPPKVETKHGSSILDLFVNAQRKYDEENKVKENGIVKGSLPLNLFEKKHEEKQKGKSARSSSSTVPIASVENEEIPALHDPCIVRSSPLRPSPSLISRSLPNNSNRSGTQRELFNYDVSPLNHILGEKTPMSLVPTQSTTTMPSKPITKQRSNSDLSSGVTPSLLSPMAFKTNKNQQTKAKDVNVNNPLISKQQLQATLIGLLESDTDFMDKIYTAFLRGSNK